MRFGSNRKTPARAITRSRLNMNRRPSQCHCQAGTPDGQGNARPFKSNSGGAFPSHRSVAGSHANAHRPDACTMGWRPWSPARRVMDSNGPSVLPGRFRRILRCGRCDDS
eukprot:scaffold126_cov315-Pavlova_lutheri.AAC.28